MAKLGDALCAAMADTFGFYFKAHVFHWNVTGPEFPAFHDLFGKIYEDAFGAVDTFAEHIRSLDEKAPTGLGELMKEMSIRDENGDPDAMGMVKALRADNEKVLECLAKTYLVAESAREVGLSNFIQDQHTREMALAVERDNGKGIVGA